MTTPDVEDVLGPDREDGPAVVLEKSAFVLVSAGLAPIGMVLALVLANHLLLPPDEVALPDEAAAIRNVDRHAVITAPDVLTVRVDESLYFPNARFLEDFVQDKIAADKAIRHLILMFPAVNEVDSSALESLEAINEMLHASGVTLHLSEVKGPVMDRLIRSPFIADLTGKVFLTQCDAMLHLAPALTADTLAASRCNTLRSNA